MSLTDGVAVRERGRVCAHEACETILSIYNPASYYSAHVTEALGHCRSGRSQSARKVACEHCGEEFETRNARRRHCGDQCRMAAFALAHRKHAAERALRRLEQHTAEPAGPRVAQLAEDAI